MSRVRQLHDAAKRSDLPAIRSLIEADRTLVNCRSETDSRAPSHCMSRRVWLPRRRKYCFPTALMYPCWIWKTTPSHCPERHFLDARMSFVYCLAPVQIPTDEINMG